ncbi:MAG TPA: DUF1302 family protein [Burkholderiaceae bacterium]|nr:DUF1302 family protein [Burkholderiaceae bacterium]HMY98434.1 DUF1302 family protein [Burkholderiaceae bacterium]HNB43090.1 DUF1302 family protein [Burkholderiaceae bacterium]HNG78133.1 DUF1302 family protein [Burkholderiaceae bacterium]
MTCNFKLTPLAAALLAATLGGAASAGETVEFGEGLKLDWRLSTTYTLSQRQKEADPVLAGNAGSNDGDNNFKKGALTANRLGLLLDTKLSKGDFGGVFSASTFYDDVYRKSNDNNAAASNPNKVNHPAPYNEFTDEARRYHGGYSRVLDAYAYGAVDTGGAGRLTLRGGRHVVSWGEALFFPGISLAQGPADGTKTGVPGTETKDQLLPEDQLSAILEVSSRWSLMAHAQYNWHPTLAAAPGSFMSASDGVGPGGVCLGPYSTIPAIPAAGFGGFSGCSFGQRGADITPSKTGQWGVGSRYRVTEETELGLYYLNYHDRTPLPEINVFTPGTAIPAALQPAFGGITQIGNGSYRVRYFDNIKLLGASFSTTFGSVAVAGEASYKDGAPVLVDAVVNPATKATIATPTRANITQLNLNAFYNIGRTPLADGAALLGEIAYVHIDGVQARKAVGSENYPAAYGFTASDQLSFRSREGLALATTLSLTYPGVFEGWDLSVPISASWQIKGRTILGGVGGEGDLRYSVGATLTRASNFSIGLTYQGFGGSASMDSTTYRPFTDRDQLSMVMKYAF